MTGDVQLQSQGCLGSLPSIRAINHLNKGIMTLRLFKIVVLLSAATATAIAFCQSDGKSADVARRPITESDYDSWHFIQSQTLSRDGKWVAYALMSQTGEAELVVRNIKSANEYRAPIGNWPSSQITKSVPAVQFTNDARFVVAQAHPSQTMSEASMGDDKSAQTKAGPALILLNTSNGMVIRLADATSFQLPEEGSKIAYRREVAGRPELDLYNLADGITRQFADVVEYSLTKDGTNLVYSVSSSEGKSNGVFVVDTETSDPGRPLLTGNERYHALVWDRGQTDLAFLGKTHLYTWSRHSASALEATSCPNEREASGTRPVTFSSDGERIVFACVDTSQKKENSGDGAVFELWHWKDPEVQSMQKSTANDVRSRTSIVVWNRETQRLTEIKSDFCSFCQDVVLSDDDRWAVTFNDSPYIRSQDYDGTYRSGDAYLVDTLTGERRLVIKKHRRDPITISPDDRYALYFDGRNWNSISIPSGRITNLTSSLPVHFYDEDNDIPDAPFPYGAAGWTRDGKYVLLYDRNDTWQISPDGSKTLNLTKSLGRKNQMSLRYVQLARDTHNQYIDQNMPLLLRAVNEQTRATGFYRTSIDSVEEPRKLIFDAEEFSKPIQDDDGDVYLLSASTFNKEPDLLVSDAEFRELRKVSDANPQMKTLLWGSAEMIPFHNASGRKLQGILYKPENFDPSKKYPMIVYIYERLSDRLYDFIPPRPEWGHAINISTYVSNGYLVLAPDITYTIGHPGQSALNCVLAAVDSVVKQGFVDENAIGIQGHSWGGLEVAYIIGHTDRFRAAEAGAVEVNMTNRYDGLSYGRPMQWGYEKNQFRIGSTLWQHPELFIENSPVFAADKIKTPLLMLGNDADPNVPFEEGIQFYMALRRLDKEVYLFNYNGEGHDLSKWQNMKDFSIRMRQFFDHFLKGSPAPDWMINGLPYSRTH
jgi:dipeptidyl aminopeptidase/acylaminoacyl peptidase